MLCTELIPNSAGALSPLTQYRAISPGIAGDSPFTTGQVLSAISALINKELGLRNGARQWMARV
jgi:hypothetical protein